MVPGIIEAEPGKVNSSASPCPQPWLWFIRLDDEEQCMHLIASRLKCPGSVFRGKLSLIQRIRAIVSHPIVARSSSGGMGLQTTRPLIASSSHAPTPCALARRIFSIGDNIWSVDNLWIAYCLIWLINIECQSVQAWVIAFGTPWSYSRLWTISGHSPTPPSPNATQDSHRKLEMRLYQSTSPQVGKRSEYMNIFMNIRRIHHFQQAGEFVLLISFKYNGKISILTFTARRRPRRQKKHVRKDFGWLYEFASRDTKEPVFDLDIHG